ncbi:GNAT family N-acetyltransferase [Phenylobacterium montanum]|uniref:GNAT family N-acetyltransferase n=1 Tax=Phenylobacterium montanum TaxID=2823693 RepID=A0A975IWK8_9CAUL|nr:GNAT family N-acetyltransferase [Caulobacter sp. S6]QUD89988.1 GNAT family N-acetyltransferase [Caulobacter sp. S6]
MSEPQPLVRRLGREDAEAYRAIRLAGLAEAPDAFAAVWEVEAERPLAHFEGLMSNLAVFGAFLDGRLVGIAGFVREAGPKLSHKGTLWGMYVDPAARRYRIGGALVQAVLDHAAGEVEQVLLAANTTNAAAIRLYERLGFVAYGREPQALKGANGYSDDLLMVKFLNGRGPDGA